MLQIFITNNIRIRGASVPLKGAVTKALTMDNPAYIARKKKRQPTYGIDQKLKLFFYDMGDVIAPRGFEEQLKEILKTQGLDPGKVIIRRQTEGQPVDFGPWNEQYALKEDQKPALEAIVPLRNKVLVAPAGSGKTLIGMRYIMEKGVPALWLTHTTDLLYQSKANAEKYLKGVGRVGVLGDGKKDYGDGKLIVATVQTLQKNPQIIEGLKPIIGTIVIDEAHHFPAPAFIDVAGQFPAVNMLGITATPDRKDLLEAYLFFGVGPIAYEITRDGLYDSGRLVKPEVKFIYTAFDKEKASDYDEELENVDAGGEDLDYTGLMKDLISDVPRAKLVAETILDNAAHNYSIVLAESVRYCFVLRDLVEKQAMARWGVVPRMAVVHGGISKWTWRVAKGQKNAQQLVDAGEANDLRYNQKLQRWQVQVAQYTDQELADWQVTAAQRKEIMQLATDRKIDILFATQLAREGLDIPHLNIGHMVTPKRGDAAGTRNGASVEQEIGRIMRPDPKNPDKKATWYDYVDFEVGVFQDQYYSRRKVYTRLGLQLPRKQKNKAMEIEDFLLNTQLFDLPL
ncbi:DEAD/DEAH box helicase [Bacillota bacterium Lsc_1132]